MRLGLLPVLLRETFGSRTLPREPEPDLVMEGDEQVAAFAEAGRIDGVMAAAYLFNSARISQCIQGCRRVVDLGCGPATQLAQIAALNPAIEFLGVDLSPGMLASAEAHLRDQGLTNVRLLESDVTAMKAIGDGSVDGVISTLALHHLPSDRHLRSCFAEIARISGSDAALCLIDLGRLKSLKSVLFFAYMNAAHQPHIFSLDYERSLRAAFLHEDFEAAVRESLPGRAIEIRSTFRIPVLIIAKTDDRPLPDDLRARLKDMRVALPSRYRRDLDDIRRFFRWGGLGNDVF